MGLAFEGELRKNCSPQGDLVAAARLGESRAKMRRWPGKRLEARRDGEERGRSAGHRRRRCGDRGGAAAARRQGRRADDRGARSARRALLDRGGGRLSARSRLRLAPFRRPQPVDGDRAAAGQGDRQGAAALDPPLGALGRLPRGGGGVLRGDAALPRARRFDRRGRAGSRRPQPSSSRETAGTRSSTRSAPITAAPSSIASPPSIFPATTTRA